MTRFEEVRAVLGSYDARYQLAAVQPLGGAGGFSGAELWRVETPGGNYCLRAWPADHPDPRRLRFIHTLLELVWNRGFRCVPVPVRTRAGDTFAQRAGRHWELSRWLPGRAEQRTDVPTERLTAALHTLALFHRAAEDLRVSPAEVTWAGVPAADSFGDRAGRPAPGVLNRRRMIDELLAGKYDTLHAAVRPDHWPDLSRPARQVLQIFHRRAAEVRTALNEAARLRVPVQACLRDVRREHVLFEGNAVSGIVDFGAAGYETVAADIARLVGTMAADDAAKRSAALAAYEQVRRLSDAEHTLVDVYDRSGVLLGAMNWLCWIYLDGRRFDRPERVLRSVQFLLRRMEHLDASGSRAAGPICGPA